MSTLKFYGIDHFQNLNCHGIRKIVSTVRVDPSLDYHFSIKSPLSWRHAAQAGEEEVRLGNNTIRPFDWISIRRAISLSPFAVHHLPQYHAIVLVVLEATSGRRKRTVRSTQLLDDSFFYPLLRSKKFQGIYREREKMDILNDVTFLMLNRWNFATFYTYNYRTKSLKFCQGCKCNFQLYIPI